MDVSEKTISEVEEIVREELDLENDTLIDINQPIIGVIPDGYFDSGDILSIFHRLGVPLTEYCSGERLNNKGKEMLFSVGYHRNNCGDCSGEYKCKRFAASVKTIEDFKNNVSVYNLACIKDYSESLKRAA